MCRIKDGPFLFPPVKIMVSSVSHSDGYLGNAFYRSRKTLVFQLANSTLP